MDEDHRGHEEGRRDPPEEVQHVHHEPTAQGPRGGMAAGC